MKDFKQALKDNDMEALRKIPKVDIHTHGILSGTRRYAKEHGIEVTFEPINNITDFIEFIRTYISPIQIKEEGLRTLLEGNFQNCLDTGIKHISTCIEYKSCIRTFNSDVDKFINFLKSFQYDGLEIHWDLAMSRDSYTDDYKQIVLDLLNTKFFSGFDISSKENSVPNEKFKDFYALANSLGMTTKVHAGEQLGADYVKECIIDFNPKQIQHGIRIIEDEQVMKLAKEKGIIFNICPTSNVVLGNAKSIKEHPIKQMVDYGLKVTINTDDILMFESDINDEYLKLYNEGTLTADQLDEIRVFGLSLFE
jgi:adenosine deaminase